MTQTERSPVPVAVGRRGAPRTTTRRRAGYRALKRCTDVLLASVALLVLLPLLVAVGLLVRITSTGPALFRQTRVGGQGRTFTMLKLRTMVDGCSDELHRDYVRRLLSENDPDVTGGTHLYKIDNDPRITPLGRVLRRASLDELPQLVNVLRGDMSLVGPRPVLPWEATLLNDEFADRFTVPAGITGLWQTSGRSTLTMRQALELDLEYVRRSAIRTDLGILLKTALVVLRPGDAR